MALLTITDMGGSLNQGRPPSAIGENEYTALSNFYQIGGKLRRRGGTRRLNVVPAADRFTGIFSYKPEVPLGGEMDVVLASRTAWYKLFNGVVTQITLAPSFTIATSALRWTMFQFKNILYGIRNGVFARSNGAIVGDSGIAAPLTAAVMADGAAGAIVAGNYIGVYTFYNSLSDVESNPSAASNTLVHAGSTKINWTSVDVSTNLQVDQRRLYRTLAGQTGEYFYVATISDNSSTTATEDVLVADMGDAVSFENGTPPANLKFGDVWKERLFASDGVDLFYSTDGKVECFDTDNFIPVFPDDGHSIRSVRAYGDRLVIGKTNKIHYLVGSDPSNFSLLTLSDRHGCVSHHSMQVAEGLLFWLGHDNVYRSDGNSVIGIGSVKLKTVIEDMTAANAVLSFATVYPKLNWYVLCIPEYAFLVYNYKTDVWAQMDIDTTSINPYMMGDRFDSNHEQSIYVSDDSGYVYQAFDEDYNYDDREPASPAGTGLDVLHDEIDASFTTRAFGGEAGTKVIVGKVALQLAKTAATIDLAILAEGSAVKDRNDLSLNYDPRWKIYSLSTRNEAKAQLQLRVDYAGVPLIEIEGISVNATPLGRPSMQAK